MSEAFSRVIVVVTGAIVCLSPIIWARDDVDTTALVLLLWQSIAFLVLAAVLRSFSRPAAAIALFVLVGGVVFAEYGAFKSDDPLNLVALFFVPFYGGLIVAAILGVDGIARWVRRRASARLHAERDRGP